MSQDYHNKVELAELALGKTVSYSDQYDPQLLQPVPRTLNRDMIGLSTTLPFTGNDIWNGYELSWLNANGMPQVAILRCYVPYDSLNIVESKSFKLYLNSFNNTRFDSIQAVQAALAKDLSECAKGLVDVEIIHRQQFVTQTLHVSKAQCLDDQDLVFTDFQVDPTILTSDPSQSASEFIYSDLLKSNCLITNQPDWASIYIKYQGPQIDHEALLRYLVSFRNHNEFHEQCVERIFCDLLTHCHCEKLTVLARYTRRGGLDINPFRSNFEAPYPDLRLIRQ
jgi:7-cyano-7-deazaguanine reductase